MATEFTEFKDEHLVDLHPRLKEYANYPFPYLRMIVRKYVKIGTIMSCMYKNRCVGIGGWFEVMPGVGHVWMILSTEVDKHGFLFIRCLKRYLDEEMLRLDLHRISADIPTNMPGWLKIVERMGFKNEGVMEAFDSKKQDYYRVALIRK